MTIDLTKYKIVVDNSSENNDSDDAALMQNGVSAIFRRMNLGDGSLALDTKFLPRWNASPFKDRQAAYMITNPAKATGEQALAWVLATKPANCKILAADVEIDYANNPGAYHTYLNTLLGGAQTAGMKAFEYSGAGFMNLVSPWITDVPAWWARYLNAVHPVEVINGVPTAVHQSITWDQLRAKLAALDWTPLAGALTEAQTGHVIMWQVTSSYILPGSGGGPIDVNLISNEDFAWLFGAPVVPPTPVYLTQADLDAALQPIRQTLTGLTLVQTLISEDIAAIKAALRKPILP